MRHTSCNWNLFGFAPIPVVLLCLSLCAGICSASNNFDIVSGVIESPLFKGKPPFKKLRLAAGLLRSKKLKHADMALILLDWSDRYLREPDDPIERLRRWAHLTNDEELRHLRIPRDYLNRVLLTEYLIHQTPYLKSAPRVRLQILRKLSQQKLVDWSVALAYSRLYAGGIITGAEGFRKVLPKEALEALKSLKEEGLVGWHYRIPAEAILCAETLAQDKRFNTAAPSKRLEIIRDLQRAGLITAVTRKELEKLPAWRLVASDKAFLKADPATRQRRLTDLKTRGLILSSTFTQLMRLFVPTPIASPQQSGPTPLPAKVQPR